MAFFSKNKTDISGIVLVSLMALCVDWDKEAIKALIMGGIIGSWLTARIK